MVFPWFSYGFPIKTSIFLWFLDETPKPTHIFITPKKQHPMGPPTSGHHWAALMFFLTTKKPSDCTEKFSEKILINTKRV
jgi:hypothetical protein